MAFGGGNGYQGTPDAGGVVIDLVPHDRVVTGAPTGMAVLYVWRALGREGARRLTEAVGREVISRIADDPNAWISYEDMRAVVEAASAICHEPDLGRPCGEELARSVAQLGHLEPLVGFSFADALPLVLLGYNEGSKLRFHHSEPLDDGGLAVHTVPLGEERDPFLCRLLGGFICELGRGFDVIPTIVEIECCARGDDRCRAVVHWTDAPSATAMTWTDHMEHLHDWTRTLTEAQDPAHVLAQVTEQFQAPPSLDGLLVAIRLGGAIYHHATGALAESTALEAARLLEDPRLMRLPRDRVVHAPIVAAPCQAGCALGVFSHTTSIAEQRMIGAYAAHVGAAIDAAVLFSEWRDTANLDALTGLINRNALARAVDALEPRARTTMLVGFLDLDGFKRVNDDLGHAAGDELLCGVAHRLQHHLRPTDIVARLGGDEFVVVLGNVCDDEAVARVQSKLESIFAEPFLCGTTPVDIGASIGVAVGIEAEGSLEALLQLADARMYEHKRARRG